MLLDVIPHRLPTMNVAYGVQSAEPNHYQALNVELDEFCLLCGYHMHIWLYSNFLEPFFPQNLTQMVIRYIVSI